MLADLVIIDDLEKINITEVYKSGKLVGKNNKAVYKDVAHPKPVIRSTVNIKWLEGDEFHIPAKDGNCRVIGIVPNQLVTHHRILKPKVENGEVIADTKRDIVKIFILERHTTSGRIGKGLIQGLGIRKGAVATSISHDSHNIIVAGVNDEDIFKAVIQINRIGGGMAVVANGKFLADVKLPIAGLMSDKPMLDVAYDIKKLKKAIRELGSTLEDPMMTLSFMALPVIPELKLTDYGLIDVINFKQVDLFVK